jgi:hypothetical protein
MSSPWVGDPEAVSADKGGWMKEAYRWKPVLARGLPPKHPRVNPLDLPFQRNPSLCLSDVLDDAFARLHHSPLEDLLGNILGIFSPSGRARGKVSPVQRA